MPKAEQLSNSLSVPRHRVPDAQLGMMGQNRRLGPRAWGLSLHEEGEGSKAWEDGSVHICLRYLFSSWSHNSLSQRTHQAALTSY